MRKYALFLNTSEKTKHFSWLTLCPLLFGLGDHLFKGFHGEAELSNETFAELDDHHHLGHVDAAFRMHSEDSPEHHDHQFFFLVLYIYV